MKKTLGNKIVRKIIEVSCIIGLTLVVNNAIDTHRDDVKEIIPVQQLDAQAVGKELITSNVELEEVVKGCINDSELSIVETENTPSNNYAVTLNNGSWVVYDREENTIVFQPAELGDWEYNFDNLEYAIGCITTYANNFNTDDTVAGRMISKDNWTSKEDDENSPLAGNMIIEDDGKIIEVSSEAYEEIEQGENSNLTGDIYLENDDIISITDKENICYYTEDDIKGYKEYKQGLINEHGAEVYNLMNQEAGINSEEDSFYHFMEYGI